MKEATSSISVQSDPYDGMTKDDHELVALGYKSEFNRAFGLWTVFSVSFALLGLLPSIASTLDFGLGTAGTPAMTWGWLVAMVGVQSVAMSMAELCSAMPTSGGLYYASAVLAPHGWGPFVAWCTGWSNWIVQVTGAPSIDYAMASMILTLKSIQDPSYSASNYQIFLLTVGIMVAQAVISCAPTKWLAQFNSAGTIINGIAIFVAIIIILTCNNRPSPKFNSSSQVWGSIDNQTDWPDGLAVLLSFVSIIWTMSGYDAPFHLSEECANAAVNAPWAIVLTASVGGLLGWALQLTISYTVVDIDQAIGSELGQPFVTYLQQVLSPKLVDFVTALTVISAFFMGQASMIGASRVAYAYARDGCFPFSSIWARVNKWTQTPVNAVWMNCVIGIFIMFLVFAGTTTISAIFSVGAIAAYVAFTLPVAMKVFFNRSSFRAGPWNLGRFSRPIGYLSVGYVLLMVPILCFPSTRGSDLDASGMNWTVVVYFGPMFMSIAWYLIYARKFFKGPKVQFGHLHGMTMDGIEGLNITHVVDAQDLDNTSDPEPPLKA